VIHSTEYMINVDHVENFKIVSNHVVETTIFLGIELSFYWIELNVYQAIPKRLFK